MIAFGVIVLDSILNYLQQLDGSLGFLILAAAAMIEYIIPPFPGDTITLFGAFLAAYHKWNPAGVLAAVVVGSVCGAMLDFVAGLWIAKYYERGSIFKQPKTRARIEKARQSFAKYGIWYLALNRFIPALRAVAFVAAGISRLSWRGVFALALISSILWNGLILGLGYSVGANWGQLVETFTKYTRVVFVAVGGVAVMLISIVFVCRKWSNRT